MFNVITLVNSIKKIGQAIPNINTVVLSDIFELNSKPDVDYSVFAIIQDTHRQDDDFFYFSFVLYYVDRLLNDKSNQLEIQSHGIQLLSTVISKIEELGLIVNHDVVQTTYQTFTQRFSDETAGVFARVEIMVPVDCQIPYDVLVDPILADITISLPGTYNPQDYSADAFKTVTVQGEYPDIWVKKEPTNLDGTSAQTVDFNDLTETGYYYIKSYNDYTLNGPQIGGWNPDGMVHVISDFETGRVVQTFYATYITEGWWPRLWWRTYTWTSSSGYTWSKWQEIATDDNAIRKEATFISWNEGKPDIDFNDFTTSGYYSLKYIYQHCVNAPVASIGDCLLNVIVDNGNFSGDDTIITQEATFTERNIPPTKYIRTFGKNGGVSGWSAWYQYTLTPVQ